MIHKLNEWIVMLKKMCLYQKLGTNKLQSMYKIMTGTDCVCIRNFYAGTNTFSVYHIIRWSENVWSKKPILTIENDWLERIGCKRKYCGSWIPACECQLSIICKAKVFKLFHPTTLSCLPSSQYIDVWRLANYWRLLIDGEGQRMQYGP